MYISKNSGRRLSNRGRVKNVYRLEEELPDDDNDDFAMQRMARQMMGDKDKPTGIEVEENHVYFYCPVMERESLELVRIIRRLDIEMSYLASRIGLEKNPPIHLHIQSPGGDIFCGLNICDVIAACKTDVYTYIEGSVASAGTMISCCGTKRFIAKNAFMLVHQPQMLFAGKHDEFIDEIENQKHIFAAVTQIYLDRTKMKAPELEEMLKHELWMPADKCVELGLVDEIC